VNLFFEEILEFVGLFIYIILGIKILAPLSLICASFTTEFWQLYLTQGLMYGVGGAMGFQPAMMIPAQYLRRNRSLAAGISICGSGIGGLALNPVRRLFLLF
jgi:MFS family permease